MLVGKRVKKWRGHFYVYERRAGGSEVRRFRYIPFGLKRGMDKGAARAKLREIIAHETSNVAPAPVNVTLRCFMKIPTCRRRKNSGRSRRGPRPSGSLKTT